MTDLFSPYRGEPPSQAHSQTSKDAAASIKKAIGPLHARVLGALREYGGMTDEELCDCLHLGGNTLRPRRRELQLMERIIDSGKMRPTRSRRLAVVWELAQ